MNSYRLIESMTVPISTGAIQLIISGIPTTGRYLESRRMVIGVVVESYLANLQAE